MISERDPCKYCGGEARYIEPTLFANESWRRAHLGFDCPGVLVDHVLYGEVFIITNPASPVPPERTGA